MNIELDHAALRAVTAGLSEAGRTFDETGRSAPGQPDAGWANGVLADILFGFCQSGAGLVGAAVGLAETGETCNVEQETTDSVVAEQFLLAAEDVEP